jgi:hypothetical protein
MTYGQVERTFICQLSKPENKAFLKEVAARKDSSCLEFVRYYKGLISRLIDTPAWGVSGVNEMINELRASVIAKLTNAKNGKTTAWAHANKLLRCIDRFANKEAKPCYNGNHKLIPPLTDEELLKLLLKN